MSGNGVGLSAKGGFTSQQYMSWYEPCFRLGTVGSPKIGTPHFSDRLLMLGYC